MGEIAKNMGEFAHGRFWILEWGILNVHPNYPLNEVILFRPKLNMKKAI